MLVSKRMTTRLQFLEQQVESVLEEMAACDRLLAEESLPAAQRAGIEERKEELLIQARTYRNDLERAGIELAKYSKPS